MLQHFFRVVKRMQHIHDSVGSALDPSSCNGAVGREAFDSSTSSLSLPSCGSALPPSTGRSFPASWARLGTDISHGALQSIQNRCALDDEFNLAFRSPNLFDGAPRVRQVVNPTEFQKNAAEFTMYVPRPQDSQRVCLTPPKRRIEERHDIVATHQEQLQQHIDE